MFVPRVCVLVSLALVCAFTQGAAADDAQTDPDRDPDYSSASGASRAPAGDLASSIDASSAVTGSQWVTTPADGASMVRSDVVAGFPTHGSTYGVMSTGAAADLTSPNDSESLTSDLGGESARGDTDFDVSVLRLDLSVPDGSNCLSLDFRFLSEEFPEYVGSNFNDAFVAELDTSSWSTSGSAISAPDNFAFDPAGNVISVNASGPTSMSAAAAAGTTYDGATPRLRASTDVEPGVHSLYLSIFDQGDHSYDSTVQLDQLILGTVAPEEECEEGAEVPDEDCTISGTKKADHLVGTPGDDVICGVGGPDVLLGEGGDDVLRGGGGPDDLVGGEGDDTLDGGENDDALRGDNGDDQIDGGDHKDLVSYVSATDGATVDLQAGTGSTPTQGTDTLISIEGAFGTKQADELFGDTGANSLFGGPDNDLVNGRGGTDLLRGTAGSDSVLGGDGADMLFGDAGEDFINGQGEKDACYGGGGGGQRLSCEGGNDSADSSKVAARAAEAQSPVRETAEPTAKKVAGGLMWRWPIGNDDYVVAYDLQATQNLAAWANYDKAQWEKRVCAFLKFTPIKTACSASNALNAVDKLQMRWFLWHAQQGGDCAVGIWDYGRHGANQFTKRWKTRAAKYYYPYKGVLIVAANAGQNTYVQVSDKAEVGREYITITGKECR